MTTCQIFNSLTNDRTRKIVRMVKRELEKKNYLEWLKNECQNRITNLDMNLVNVLQGNKTTLIWGKHL